MQNFECIQDTNATKQKIQKVPFQLDVSSDLGTQGKDKFWSQPLNRQKHIQKSAYELRATEEQIFGDGKRPTRPYVFP